MTPNSSTINFGVGDEPKNSVFFAPSSSLDVTANPVYCETLQKYVSSLVFHHPYCVAFRGMRRRASPISKSKHQLYSVGRWPRPGTR